MKTRWLFVVSAITAVCSSFPVAAQRVGRFEELKRAMAGHLQSRAQIDPKGSLVSCFDEPLRELDAAEGTVLSQWIYNGSYDWKLINTPEGLCVYLLLPFKRGLSVDEAQILLSASSRQWPVDDDPHDEASDFQPAPRNKILDDNMERIIPCPVGKKQEECREMMSSKPPPSPALTDNRVFIDDGQHDGYPWNAMALVELPAAGGNARYSTATQISPYVWVTAAHTIYDLDNKVRWSGHLLRPSWKLPLPNNSLKVTAVIDEIYTSFASISDERSDVHDLAFFRSTKKHTLPQYPVMQVVNETRNCYDINSLYVGKSYCDPYFSQIPGIPSFYGWNVPYPSDPTRSYTGGYPYWVGNQDNTLNFRPVADLQATVNGAPLGYKMYTPNAPDAASVIGLYSWTSTGDSGGPIFAQQCHFWGNGAAYGPLYLLGIVTAFLNIDPNFNSPPIRYSLGAGKGFANSAFYDYNKNWVPGYPINLLIPPDGVIYDNQNVPDFSATASVYTPQLHWSSSIDGDLGTGGIVPVDNILSPGNHTITVTLGNPMAQAGQESPGSTPAGEEVTHITVTATPAFLSAAPSLVPFGHDKSPQSVAINWLSTAYPYVDLNVSINGGTPTLATSGVTSGALVASVERGKTYTYTLFRSGRTIELASATVTTADVPWIFASINPVVLPPGQPNGTTHLTWDAAGKANSVDIRVSLDGAPSTLLAWTPGTGSDDPSWIQPGHAYRFTMSPHNNAATVLAWIIVKSWTTDTLFADDFELSFGA